MAPVIHKKVTIVTSSNEWHYRLDLIVTFLGTTLYLDLASDLFVNDTISRSNCDLFMNNTI